MIAAILRSSIVLLAAAGAATLFRRQSAAVRHTIWTAGLLAAIVAPLFSLVLPSWRSEFVGTISRELNPPAASRHVATGEGIITVVEVHASRAEASNPSHLLYWIWLVGFGVATIRLLAGTIQLMRVGGRSELVASTRLTSISARVAASLRLKRTIRLLQGDKIPRLGTFGVFRCSVFLPSDAEAWPDEKLEIVLSHELAHIQRHDWLVQLIGEIARAIYWFNPLFWLACRRLRRESEHACDDAVLNLGIQGQTYATHLLELARASNRSVRTWSPILAMAQPPDLERRFIAMLNPNLNHKPITPRVVLVVSALAICLVLPVAAMKAAPQEATPQLVQQQNIQVAELPVPELSKDPGVASPEAQTPAPAPASAPAPVKAAPKEEPPAAADAPKEAEQRLDRFADRRVVILFFDLSSMQPEEIKRVIEYAKNYIDAQMQPADLVGVVSYSTRLDVVQEFTSNKEWLDEAIDSLLNPQSGAGVRSAPVAGENIFNNDQRLLAIRQVAETLEQIQQKKSMLYLSSGLTKMGPDNQLQVREAISAAEKANLAIYTVDVRGLLPLVPLPRP